MARTTNVIISLMLHPLLVRNASIRPRISSASSSGLRMATMSSAYLITWCSSSTPFNAMLARSGLTTPPCGVPCSGNSGLTPAFRHLRVPVKILVGAIISLSMTEWLRRSKHLEMSISRTLFSNASCVRAEVDEEELLPRYGLPRFTGFYPVTNHALVLSEFTKSSLKEITPCPTRIVRVPHHVLPTWGLDLLPRLTIRFYSFLFKYWCVMVGRFNLPTSCSTLWFLKK